MSRKIKIQRLIFGVYGSSCTHGYRWNSLKQLLYHGKVESKTKSSFEILRLVNLFTEEITFQYHFSNLFNSVKQRS